VPKVAKFVLICTEFSTYATVYIGPMPAMPTAINA